MAGIYLHIPFCKRRCIYCDFFSTTQGGQTDRYIQTLCKELEQRKEYLEGEDIETIYLGGGTPSQLQEKHFEQIFSTLYIYYPVRPDAEITLEANPDDLNKEYVTMLRHFPFNRLSMGIQTFNDTTLRLLHRRHTAQQAIDAFERCRSAYHLIYEEGTPLWKLREEHRVSEIDEDLSVSLFSELIHTLKTAGYEHYEISNFCLPDKYSRHNSSYWTGKTYLGCGASAHSFENHKPDFEKEELDLYTRYNDFIITSLRTMWGMSLTRLKTGFGEKLYDYCIHLATPHLQQHTLQQTGDFLKLTEQGIFISDSIMSDLLWVDD